MMLMIIATMPVMALQVVKKGGQFPICRHLALSNTRAFNPTGLSAISSFSSTRHLTMAWSLVCWQAYAIKQ